MPTKKEIERINSRKISQKGFSEKELREAGFQAIADVMNNKFEAYYNSAEVYRGFGGPYSWSVINSSVDTQSIADFFNNDSPVTKRTIAG